MFNTKYRIRNKKVDKQGISRNIESLILGLEFVDVTGLISEPPMPVKTICYDVMMIC